MTSTFSPDSPVLFKPRSDWGKTVDIDTINRVHVPQLGPDSWRALPHGTLVEMIEQAYDRHGFTVSDPVHHIGRTTKNEKIKDQGDYGRFLTMYGLSHPKLRDIYGFNWESAWFNSYDMTKAIQFAIGGRVTWCANGQMWAEDGVTVKRKHTVGIDRDHEGHFDTIYEIIDQAMAGILPAADRKADMIEQYQSTGCEDTDARFVILEAAKAKVIGAAATMRVLKHWETPEHHEFKDRNVWSLHNAFTSNDRGNSLMTQADRMSRLETIISDRFQFSCPETQLSHGNASDW